MLVIKSVSTPMDLTTVIVDLAIGLLWMKYLAMVYVASMIHFFIFKNQILNFRH